MYGFWSQATGIQNPVPGYCVYAVGEVSSPINGETSQGCWEGQVRAQMLGTEQKAWD